MSERYDLCIVGSGMVGASLACGFADSGARIAVLEAAPRSGDGLPSYDDRGLALSLATQRILDALGVWSELARTSTPIRRIHVSEQNRFGSVRLEAAKLGIDAFGHVVVARELGQVLLRRLDKAENVKVHCPARVQGVTVGGDEVEIRAQTDRGERNLHCRLLVAADGSHSTVRDLLGVVSRTHDYGQTAIVANVTPERSHGNCAFERFSGSGPLAVLPLSGGRCVSVCSVPRDGADQFLGLNDPDYLVYLESRLGLRLGRLRQLGSRRAYPLIRIVPEKQTGPRFVLLGNAAHTLHPNAAQGFNLAVRDVAALVEYLLPAFEAGRDPGASSLLEAYAESRKADQQRVERLTDGLARVYSGNGVSDRILRRAGLLCAELVPPVKRRLVRAGMGLWGRQPAWVCGRTLR